MNFCSRCWNKGNMCHASCLSLIWQGHNNMTPIDTNPKIERHLNYLTLVERRPQHSKWSLSMLKLDLILLICWDFVPLSICNKQLGHGHGGEAIAGLSHIIAKALHRFSLWKGHVVEACERGGGSLAWPCAWWQLLLMFYSFLIQ